MRAFSRFAAADLQPFEIHQFRQLGRGVDHLGIQAHSDTELAELKARAVAADLSLLDEGATSCCYARSEKYWVTDPQGIAWEQFHTLRDIPVFSEKACAMADAAAGCAGAGAPVAMVEPIDAATRRASPCC